MAKKLKKLFVTLLGLSLIAAPLLCCCIIEKGDAPQVAVSHKPCHQPENAAQQTSHNEHTNCDCQKVVSIDANKVVTAFNTVNSTIAFSSHKGVSLAAFSRAGEHPFLSTLQSLAKLKQSFLPAYLQFSILRL